MSRNSVSRIQELNRDSGIMGASITICYYILGILSVVKVYVSFIGSARSQGASIAIDSVTGCSDVSLIGWDRITCLTNIFPRSASLLLLVRYRPGIPVFLLSKVLTSSWLFSLRALFVSRAVRYNLSICIRDRFDAADPTRTSWN